MKDSWPEILVWAYLAGAAATIIVVIFILAQ